MEQSIRTYAHKQLEKLGYSVLNLSNGGLFVKSPIQPMDTQEITLTTSVELSESEIYKFAIAHLESELSEQSKGHPDMEKIRSAIDEVKQEYKNVKYAVDNMVADLDSAEFCLNGNSIEVESIDLDVVDAENTLADLQVSLDNLYEITNTH
jgi:hypothetical protein